MLQPLLRCPALQPYREPPDFVLEDEPQPPGVEVSAPGKQFGLLSWIGREPLGVTLRFPPHTGGVELVCVPMHPAHHAVSLIEFTPPPPPRGSLTSHFTSLQDASVHLTYLRAVAHRIHALHHRDARKDGKAERDERLDL
jgi:hypothetical protein